MAQCKKITQLLFKAIQQPSRKPAQSGITAQKTQIAWKSNTSLTGKKVESTRRVTMKPTTVRPTRAYTRRREMTLIDPNKRPTIKPPIRVPFRRVVVRKLMPRNISTTTTTSQIRTRNYYETTTIRRVLDDPFADVYNQRRERNRVRARDTQLARPSMGQGQLIFESNTVEPEDSEEESAETEEQTTAQVATTEISRSN